MGLAAQADPSVVAKMRQAAESLVIRARAGDQNAIAMISEVRKNVPRSRRAALAYDLLCDYVKKNPVGKVAFGFASRVAGKADPLLYRAIHDVVGGPKYAQVVQLIEKLPTSVDRYAEAACLVADGKNVDELTIRAVLPNLRGEVMVVDGKPMTFDQLRASGKKFATDWTVRVDRKLTIATRDGCGVGFSRGGRAVLSTELFRWAFDNAGYTDRVLEFAEPWPKVARQPIRVGYVMGLARNIQMVTRRRGPIAELSETAGWELGE